MVEISVEADRPLCFSGPLKVGPAHRTRNPARSSAARRPAGPAALLLSLTVVLSCKSTTVTPVEVPVIAVGAANNSPTVFSARPPAADARPDCTLELNAGRITTGPGCVLDERISHGPGRLTYPCSGDGAATAVFEDQRYEGHVRDGHLALALTAELDWDGDGCHWESKHAITGPVPRANAAQLVWAYTERPVRGVRCSGSCTGRAALRGPQAATAPDEDDIDP